MQTKDLAREELKAFLLEQKARKQTIKEIMRLFDKEIPKEEFLYQIKHLIAKIR